MTTFLEFFCSRLIGPPTRTNGNGESFWPCPACGGKWHTMPLDGRNPHRFYCFGRCNSFGPKRTHSTGDAMDLLLIRFPHETKKQHGRRWKALMAEFEQLELSGGADVISPPR